MTIYQKYRDPSFEVQVGLHELTGHGCGKLLQETAPGEFNFDAKNPPVSPLTNEPVTTWYKPGQTWGSVFGGLAGAYEVGLPSKSFRMAPLLTQKTGMPSRTRRHVSEL
jgi:dipeptidyl-peptidase-3